MLKLSEILKKGRKNKPRNNTFTRIQTLVTKAAITVRTQTFYILPNRTKDIPDRRCCTTRSILTFFVPITFEATQT